jgi:hypothetical protein
MLDGRVCKREGGSLSNASTNPDKLLSRFFCFTCAQLQRGRARSGSLRGEPAARLDWGVFHRLRGAHQRSGACLEGFWAGKRVMVKERVPVSSVHFQRLPRATDQSPIRRSPVSCSCLPCPSPERTHLTSPHGIRQRPDGGPESECRGLFPLLGDSTCRGARRGGRFCLCHGFVPN